MPVPKDVYDFLTASHPDLTDLALWVRAWPCGCASSSWRTSLI